MRALLRTKTATTIFFHLALNFEEKNIFTMKKQALLTFLLMLTTLSMCYAQKYMTRTGKISFFSSTPIENIEAINHEVGAILDMGSGDIAFIVPIKSFRFEKALMQEHFNENYMESDTYPNSRFKGSIVNVQEVNLSKPGTYPVQVKGDLTIHGVTKNITVPGTIIVEDQKVITKAQFLVKPEDYKIKIPALVTSKISKEIEITIDCSLQKS